MKIGAMDLMWYNLPLKDRLERIAEIGFKGFQPWLLTAELGFKIPRSWFPSNCSVKRIKMSPYKLGRLIEEIGIEITCWGPHYVLGEPPIKFGDPGFSEFKNEENRKRRIKDIKKLIEYAAEMEVKIVTLFSGGDPRKRDYWHDLVDLMRLIVDFCEKSNVTLAMENMPQLLVNDEDSLLQLINDVGSKWLKVNFDPKNLNVLGRNVIEAVFKLKEKICYSHAGDSIPGKGIFGKEPGSSWIMPVIGKGDIPYLEYLKALKQINYDGWVVIEYGGDERGFEHGMIESKKNLEDILLLF